MPHPVKTDQTPVYRATLGLAAASEFMDNAAKARVGSLPSVARDNEATPILGDCRQHHLESVGCPRLAIKGFDVDSSKLYRQASAPRYEQSRCSASQSRAGAPVSRAPWLRGRRSCYRALPYCRHLLVLLASWPRAARSWPPSPTDAVCLS